jgi:CBS domain-containing protein
MKVKDYMNTPVYAVSPRDSVATARNLLIRYKIGRLVVMDESGDLRGILSKSDLSNRLYKANPTWKNRPLNNVPVQVVMSRDPVTISPEIEIDKAARLMVENDIGSLPVISDKGVMGIITKTDIVKYFFDHGKDLEINEIVDEIITVHKYHSIFHVIEQMVEMDAHRVVVVDDDQTPLGIITHSDLAFTSAFETGGDRKVELERRKGDVTVRSVKKFFLVAGDLMSQPLITVPMDTTLKEAAKVILDKRIDAVIILDDSNLAGQISKFDIVKLVAEGEV